MPQIIALGGNEFTLGFQLAGVKTIEVDNNISSAFEQVLEDKEIGILITDNKTISKVEEHLRAKLMESVKPVTVIVSEEESQEELRRQIKKSIGVDLWKS